MCDSDNYESMSEYIMKRGACDDECGEEVIVSVLGMGERERG